MFALLLVGFSLAPLGLLLVFWSMFPQDRNTHPIYRESEVETLDKAGSTPRFQQNAERSASFENTSAIQTR